MDQAHNPPDVSGVDVVVPVPQDVGLDMLRRDPQDQDLNMDMSESETDVLNMMMPHSCNNDLTIGMPQSQDLNMVGPLDSGLDPAVAKAMVATSECHSVLPLIKLELNTRIKLRRPNLTVSTKQKTPPEMTEREKAQREKVRTRNKHHANMSRIRKREKEKLLEEEVAQYETGNARLKDEIANSQRKLLYLMDQAHNPPDVPGVDVVPQDVGLDMLRRDPQDQDLNMAMSESETDVLNMMMPHSCNDYLTMGMPQSQDLNMVDPLDNGLDPAVAKAMVATSECHSVLPLIKLELNTRIKLRRPNLTVSTKQKTPPEMTEREKAQREKIRTRNKHHANMSRIRKRETEKLLKEEVAQYETGNARLKDEIANSRGQIQILEDVLLCHECLQRPRDTPPT
ncbi:uncharacterized protein [Haliotis asinina]|uniref:uncharacterized protein n=1 Tax=Haliotis asinina TaxID=109174 RepID=UPI003531C5D6